LDRSVDKQLLTLLLVSMMWYIMYMYICFQSYILGLLQFIQLTLWELAYECIVPRFRPKTSTF